MIDGVDVRVAGDKDVGAMNQIYQECRGYFGFPEENDQTHGFVRALIESGHTDMIAAFRGSVAVGYVALAHSISTAHMGKSLNVVDVYISESERGSGIGGAMMKLVDDYATRIGARSSFLVTFEKDAAGFYERHGWSIEPLVFLRKGYGA